MARATRPQQPNPRRLASMLVLAAALACGDAVTNPSLEGFDADPRIIAGTWATLINDAQGNTTRLDAELTPAGGVFLGVFHFFRLGTFFTLQFNDGTWNGTRLAFTATTTINGQTSTLPWEAVYRPVEAERPERLLLISDVIGVPVEYVRPSDLP